MTGSRAKSVAGFYFAQVLASQPVWFYIADLTLKNLSSMGTRLLNHRFEVPKKKNRSIVATEYAQTKEFDHALAPP